MCYNEERVLERSVPSHAVTPIPVKIANSELEVNRLAEYQIRQKARCGQQQKGSAEPDVPFQNEDHR